MITTSSERTARIPFENRLVFAETIDTNRTVRIRAQDRTVFVKTKPKSIDRVVYAEEV